ncbi:hypothetical protein AVDCRST_MAG81-4352 [uncultured Synechococcales cyanobacterium]|uniref:Uncharacterized protein n=1 Tax=uncultured Synechococcales cyanobacterium TaxID=1936017 RepID=A0A6J4VUI0_9CYAN|nr:hypothetical protein AVDCRST_MAG81-4352 [uncultured Synechococcales cyanobacterium]
MTLSSHFYSYQNWYYSPQTHPSPLVPGILNAGHSVLEFKA